MKLKKLTLTLLILGISLILGSYASLQASKNGVSLYRSIVNAETGMVYNVPIKFPNPFDAEEMANFESMPSSIYSNIMIIVYNEIDKDGEEVDFIYGLVFDARTDVLLAALVTDVDRINWRFWIYPEDIPVLSTMEDQDSFLRERDKGSI